MKLLSFLFGEKGGDAPELTAGTLEELTAELARAREHIAGIRAEHEFQLEALRHRLEAANQAYAKSVETRQDLEKTVVELRAEVAKEAESAAARASRELALAGHAPQGGSKVDSQTQADEADKIRAEYAAMAPGRARREFREQHREHFTG